MDEYYKAKNEFSAKVKTSDSTVTGRLTAWVRVHCQCSQNITSVNYQKELQSFFLLSPLSDNRRWNASAAVSEEARGREGWAARGILSSWHFDHAAVCGTAQTSRTTLQRLQSARQEVCHLFIVLPTWFIVSASVALFLFCFNERIYPWTTFNSFPSGSVENHKNILWASVVTLS